MPKTIFAILAALVTAMMTPLSSPSLLKAAIALFPLLVSISLTTPAFSSPMPSNSTHFAPPAPPDPGEPSGHPQGGGTR